MRAHDFAQAHAISDAALSARTGTADDPSLPFHLRWVWDGTAPDGREVLVRCYHGFGDTVQFARFLPALARRARVRVEVQAALLDFLPAQFPDVAFVAFDPARPVAVPPGGVGVEIMELQFLLRADAGSAPYLTAPRAAGMGDATAVCWRSGGWDVRRDVPFEPLRAQIPGKLVCVQRDAEEDGFFAAVDAATSVGALASILRGVRRVVTVDTFVAHLAGALGVPVTVLLRAEADWRWGSAATTPWYPSATLLRQRAEGDWSVPLAGVAA